MVSADTEPASGEHPSHVVIASSAATWSGYGLLALILLIEAFYAVYLCGELRSSALEQRYMDIAAGRTLGAVPPFAALVATVQALSGGDDRVAARAVSIIAILGATLTAFGMGRRVTGDPVAAAAMTLPFVLFPPLTATYATATPHALVATFILAATLDSATENTARHGAAGRIVALLKSALLTLVAATLHPVGGPLSLAGIAIGGCVTGWSRPWRLRLLVSATVVVTILATGVAGRWPREPDLADIGHASIRSALLMPYGMIWVGFLLSGVTLLLSATRGRLGRRGLGAAALGAATTIVAPAAALLSGWWTPGQLVTGMAYVFPLALFGFLPLITWVRWVMPTVKAFWAWVVFPVVMYSCFWVVLGPINLDRYPYAVRAGVAPLPP